MKQASFEWAKDFLQSPGWIAVLNSPNTQGTLFTFTLHRVRPQVSISEYEHELPVVDSEDVVSTDVSGASLPDHSLMMPPLEDSLLPTMAFSDGPFMETPSLPPAVTKKTPRAKRGKSLCISEADLRRSDRLHNISKGFKSPICQNRNCLGCTSIPPLLSPSVVRDLGASFCNVNPDLLTDDKLGAKPSKKRAVSKPKTKKAKQSTDAEEDQAVAELVVKPAAKKSKKPEDLEEASTAEEKKDSNARGKAKKGKK